MIALAGSTHPGPSIAVSLITVGLGFAIGLDASRIVILGLAMLAGQFSVGLSNDWIDAGRDRAVGRQDKPIARGWISVGAVRAAAWTCAAVSVILALLLGWPEAVVLFVATALAWTYNLGLKKTVFSIAPYVLSFGLLPAVATLALPVPAAPAPWALGVGGLLGAAAHFANTLPDLDDDRVTGVRGLPQRLGRRGSSVVTYVVLLAASLLEIFGAGGFGFLPADLGLAVTVVIIAVGGSMILRPTRWHFRLIIVGAMVDVLVLTFAGQRLIA
jgi:4-hydroxybenzoate polyprenyltransferase